MAWQSPSAMNAGGAVGGGDGNAATGTEYTLQGKGYIALLSGGQYANGSWQELCASYSWNGIATSAREMPGILSAQR